MWKPYDCSFAQKGEVVELASRCCLYLKKVDLKGVLSYVTSTITIVAFLMAAEYFTAKPSLRIEVHSDPHGYYIDSLLGYYRVNKIAFPKQLMEDQSLRTVFSREVKSTDPNYTDIGAGTSDEEHIGAIVKGQDLGSFVEYLTVQLERQIDKYTYFKHVYGYSDERGFYDEQRFKPVRDYIRSKLSTNDYYIFLAAMIRSREVAHLVYIKNDGDLDLKNIRVTFPAPLSKVTESRANNILSVRPATSLLHEIVIGTSDVTLRLPSLKKGQFLTLDIRTRENEIKSDEIFTSYERDTVLNGGRVLNYFLFVLGTIFVLSRVCQGSKSRAEQSNRDE
jgi:hypothetical protein